PPRQRPAPRARRDPPLAGARAPADSGRALRRGALRRAPGPRRVGRLDHRAEERALRGALPRLDAPLLPLPPARRGARSRLARPAGALLRALVPRLRRSALLEDDRLLAARRPPPDRSVAGAARAHARPPPPRPWSPSRPIIRPPPGQPRPPTGGLPRYGIQSDVLPAFPAQP